MKNASLRLLLALALCAAAAAAIGGASATAGAGTTQIPLAGTGSPQTGDFTPSSDDGTQVEFPGQQDSDAGPGAYQGNIIDRSLSTGVGNGVSVNSGKKAKSNPVFNFGFEGLNH